MLLWERNTMFLGVREKNLSEFDEKKNCDDEKQYTL